MMPNNETKNKLFKNKLHPRNLHNAGYDFTKLICVSPPLKAYVIQNKFNDQPTINFNDVNAVKALNLALLVQYYKIKYWDIPQNYLCPPIPGRVDYIHYLADLLAEKNPVNTPSKSVKENITKQSIKVLDIGTGASCIYPILGAQIYNWHFVATDIDPVSIQMANTNIKSNVGLSNKITCRLQKQPKSIFEGVIKPGEFYHLTMCNPPFHKSLQEANEGSVRKWKNLNKNKDKKNNTTKHQNQDQRSQNATNLNFGGQKAELWCEGGELVFIKNMIRESKIFRQQVKWFTCLVSKKDHIGSIKLALKKSGVSHIKIINMAQGQKISRFIAWSFK
jgi:23S rRNA (adenine1618-N6)-methyltransferase